jgi:ParB/RepB/Spo0J family partition protein
MNNIKGLGILQPLRARERVDDASGEAYFELIDGLQRLTAAQMLGFETVPIEIATANDVQILVEQMALNAARVQTQPAQYGQQLLRMLRANPLLTLSQLAEMSHMSEAWVSQRLAITKLLPQIQELVDAEAITASNAYQLSRLPQDEQVAFVEQAQTAETGEFAGQIATRLKEIRKARAAGRDPNASTEFEPVPTLRRASAVKEADPQTIIDEAGAKTALEGAKATINWVLQLNPTDAEAQKQRHAARKKQQDEEKAVQKAERAGELAKKAADRAAELKQLLGIV